MAERFVPAVITDLQNLKRTIGGLELEREFIRNSLNRLEVRQGPLKIKSGDATSLLTWGVDKWGEAKWGNLTGTDLTSVRIINHQNTFLEPFFVTDYKNTTVTTAVWSGNGILEMDGGDIAQSEVFALDTTAFTQAKITVVVDDLQDLDIEMSFDGGSTFQDVVNGVLTKGATSSVGGLVWKLTNASGSAQFPLTFPIEFTSFKTVSRITVSYDN